MLEQLIEVIGAVLYYYAKYQEDKEYLCSEPKTANLNPSSDSFASEVEQSRSNDRLVNDDEITASVRNSQKSGRAIMWFMYSKENRRRRILGY